jgi:hypothetical protein
MITTSLTGRRSDFVQVSLQRPQKSPGPSQSGAFSFKSMVHQAGFEPTTPAFGVLKADV